MLGADWKGASIGGFSMSVEQLRQDLRDIRIFCSRYFPFVVIPLSYMRIVATDKVPTAGVDERGVLAINPEWWFSLSVEARRFVALHESLHTVLLHPFRRKGFDKQLYNLAADGKVNGAIRNAGVSGVEYSYQDEVTLEKIANAIGFKVEDLQRMSTEEIARELEKKAVKTYIGGAGKLDEDLIDGEAEGEVVQEGDPSVSGNKSLGELEREWKLILERSRDFAKQAGNMPAGLERIVEEVLEVKPPWYITLRFGLRNHSKQDSSFAYPSRRGDEYPGYYGYRYTVWCLIDTSGSISEDELKHFLGVLKHEARRADVYAIPWDGEAYEVLKAVKPADVARRIAPRMRGGGGTVIAPALRKVYSLMNLGDAVIVLTDGDIFDVENEETKALFGKVSSKAGFAMVGYTHSPVEVSGFAVSRLELEAGKNEA